MIPIIQEPPKDESTRAGNYFVSNYPPYSVWNAGHIADALAHFDRPPVVDAPLGLYVHIPFCRKRCHFCYFKVYTDKNASEVDRYIDSVLRELTIYAAKPFVGGRKPRFIYFGGGTPSHLSSTQLAKLVNGMKALLPWDDVEEAAFECEPGTITEGKIKLIREQGFTRLSLGIENFSDEILKANGRAHLSKEIDRAYRWCKDAGFPEINIDLISGMVGETDENWRDCVQRTVEMSPDSVTIYQMEVPYNTTLSREMKEHGETVAPVASWKTKREWVGYAFSELEKAGYTVASGYTAVKNAKTKFLYRDMLWAGADMLGLGVASFSHVQGTHFQNDHDFDSYGERLSRGELPLFRALTPKADERMIREFVLQMKLGRIQQSYFEQKFGVDPRLRFAVPLEKLRQQGLLLSTETDTWKLSREALLRVDSLLPDFFKPEHLLARRV